MLFRAPAVVALLSLLPTALVPGLASAQTPDTERAQDEEEEPPALVPFRRDLVGGHFQVGATGSFVSPFGSASRDLGTLTRVGWGGGGALDLSYGFDRFVALGAYAEMGRLGDSLGCPECTGDTLGVGAFARYHISQGLKLDPWVSYGVGYFALNTEDGPDSFGYAGVDWMRLQAGANWYAGSNFVFGPVLGLNAGHAIQRPSEEPPGGPLVRATIGLRLAFDTPGRP